MKKIIVVVGPSGIGKTYLAKELLKKYSSEITEIRIYTTRKQRTSEQNSPDRIFINHHEFNQMKERGEFWFYGEFHNNLYGFTRESLQPKDKHLIVNVWPYAVPEFLQLDGSILVGLAIRSSDITLLKERMKARGDSNATIKERLPLIQRDSQDLETQKMNFRASDRLFYIKDDRTIPEEVIPWLESNLDL